MKLRAIVIISVFALIVSAGCGGGNGGGGGGNPVAPSITVQPASRTATAGGTATFSVAASGTAPLSYRWQRNDADIMNAPNSASYTTPILSVAGDNGAMYRVIVSNAAGTQTSQEATLTVNPPAPGTASVLTYHNDIGRTGLNPNETELMPSNVNQTTFGNLGSITVAGLVDAEPLYVPAVMIGGVSHNVLVIATENDMVYAFDADTFAQLWSVSVLPGGEALPTSGDVNCGQVDPTLGITSTPVIDPSDGAHGSIFLVAMSKAGGTYHQRLRKLDLTTGADLVPATDIQASVPGTGTGNSGGTQTFAPGSYEERTALLLVNGVIYTAWTSHCDNVPPAYTSWVISFNESDLSKLAVLNLDANGTTQNGQDGGIWMSGSGPAADANGFVYLLVGNGSFDTTLSGGFPNKGDFGNSFVKLMPSGSNLTVADYFAMDNPGGGDAESESTADTDLGSGGAMVLPDIKDNANTIHHLAVGAGKDDNMYIVNRESMGKFAGNDANIYQELTDVLDSAAGGGGGGIWSAPAYFNNTIYYGPVNNHVLAFPISNAKVASSPSSSSTHIYGYPGTTPSISSNGITNGIVWTIENGNTTGVLHAYDATNLNTELYNSNQAGGSFATAPECKFVTPMIANGKVYVGTPGAVVVFGLLNQGTKLLLRKPAPPNRHNPLPVHTAPHPGSSTPGN